MSYDKAGGGAMFGGCLAEDQFEVVDEIGSVGKRDG